MNIRRMVVKGFTSAPLAALFLAFTPTLSHANAIFSFNQVGGTVVMTSSGTVNLNNLVHQGSDGWGGTGFYQDGGGYNLLGGTSMGQNDTTYMFHAGTDLSPWANSVSIFPLANFSPSGIAGTKPFATFAYFGGVIPGLSIRSADIVNSTWTSDQQWTYNGSTLASLGLQVGAHSITDAITGETLTIQIGQTVPEPMSLGLLGVGLAGLGFGRRRKQKQAA